MCSFVQALQSFSVALFSLMNMKRTGASHCLCLTATRIPSLSARGSPWRDGPSCRVRSVDVAGHVMNEVLHVCGCFNGEPDKEEMVIDMRGRASLGEGGGQLEGL